MSRFWSDIVHRLTPYVPGEQPALAHPVKLNTNENPYPPSPRVVDAIRRELGDDGESLRKYPDPTARALRATVARITDCAIEQVFAGNGSDEVLAHAFQALLKHDKPIRFPDITYSFYPVYAQLYGVAFDAIPLDDAISASMSTTIARRTAACCCRIRTRRRAARCRSPRSKRCCRRIRTRRS